MRNCHKDVYAGTPSQSPRCPLWTCGCFCELVVLRSWYLLPSSFTLDVITRDYSCELMVLHVVSSNH